MRITVTQDDIDKGCRKDAFGCAVARAVCRALGVSEDESVGVDDEAIDFYDELQGRPTAKVPAVATLFIMAFDRGDPVQPFSFWLDIGDGAEPFVAPEVATEPVPA